ncbi:MAG: valine--tRNA ligase [Candidatus Odinarchaeia archaeon]
MEPKLKEKRWRPEYEEEIVQQWEEKELYRFNKNTDKPIFSIDTPPPYASGRWHLGGVIHYSQIDIIARYKRMSGYEVIFPLGIDRNGLPVEVQAEKEFKISMRDTPREKFIELCRQLLDKYEKEIIYIAKRLGLSCNSFKNEEIYRTDSPEYRRITQATFIKLWKDNLIYVDSRPNNWCPVCGTTIADAEIEYDERETVLNYIKFRVKETGEDLIIATTRPELLCACAVVMVNPEDERYKHLHHKTAVTPIYNKEVPILPHPEAEMEFGTGVVMTCSYGDYTDVRLFRELGLTPINAISPEGKMTEAAGKYANMTVEEARNAIIEDLKEKGLLVKQETIYHRTPICWRSKNPIEFISMPEYYLKQLDYLDEIREIAHKMKWHPPEYKQILLNWLDSIKTDWPISRRRYYGNEIPLWYCKNCNEVILPPPGRYYQPWREKPPVEKCPKCGSTEFVGEERTFDTWFDSSISQLQILKYMRDDELFNKAFPCSIRPQGKDIIRTWLYYSLLRTYQLLGKQAFRMIWISGMVVDEQGRAMHKSLGNIIWPEPLLKKYGADALRLFGCLEAGLGSDVRFSEGRVGGAFKFLTKLWNIARFISMFPKPKDGFKLTNMDHLILAALNDVIKKSLEGYEKLDFQPPAIKIRSFTWEIFASHYLEAVKARAYNTGNQVSEEVQKGAWYTLHTVLDTILRLLAPICPFITEKIYLQLNENAISIHLTTIPQPRKEWESPLLKLMPLFTEFNSAVWSFKTERKIALNAPLNEVYAPKELEPLALELKLMHNIKQLKFEKPEDAESYPAIDKSQQETLPEKVQIKLDAQGYDNETVYIKK